MPLAAPELTRDHYLEGIAKRIPEGAPEAPLNAWQAEIVKSLSSATPFRVQYRPLGA
jgi:hypothetical protein